jgi:methyl-accepting chemotaxis protein
LRRMTIGKKLIGGTLTMLAVSAVSGYITSRIVAEVRDLAGHGLTNASKVMDSVGKLNTRMALVRFAQRGVLLYTLAGDSEEAAAQEKRLDATFREIHANIAELRPLLNAEGSSHSLDEFELTVNQYEALSRELVADANQGHVPEGIAILKGKSKPLGAAMEASSGDIARREREWVGAAMVKVGQRAQAASWVQWICVLAQMAAVVVLIVVSWRIVVALRQSTSELKQVAREVTGEAQEAADRSRSLSTGAADQAASLEETSASTEELLAMTGQINDNSEKAAECMGLVTSDVKHAESALDRAAAAMEQLTTSQHKVAGIIQTIDGIAFQTNLLALNAAVEAARSGAAGAGFAVVADEVRTLAQRCAQAARDTAALIEESGARSREAEHTLTEVATSVRAITTSAVKGRELVDSVHVSCQEQSKGIQQISQAMTVVSQTTERAAAMADQEAAAEAAMLGQMENLSTVVDAMTVMVSEARPTPVAPVPSASCPPRLASETPSRRNGDEYRRSYLSSRLTRRPRCIPDRRHCAPSILRRSRSPLP